MTRIGFGLGLAASLGLAGTACAQPIEGLYIGASTLWNAKQIEPLAPAPRIGLGSSERLRFDEGGVGASGSVGYGFGNGLRMELEATYRQDGIRMFATSVPGTGSGTQQDYGAMFNTLYDIDLRRFGVSFATPYLGIGLGYQWTHLDGLVTVRDNAVVSHIGGTDGGFAYQGIVGAAFPVPAVPGLAVTAEYRFLGISGGTLLKGQAYAGRTRLTSPVQLTQNLNHSILVGLRYAFNQPPVAPVGAPPSAPKAELRSFQVTFAGTETELTPFATQTLQHAAEASSSPGTTRIWVKAPDATAARLSERRIQAVADELLRLGVSPSVLQSEAAGGRHGLAPGAEDPQAHHVVIIPG